MHGLIVLILGDILDLMIRQISLFVLGKKRVTRKLGHLKWDALIAHGLRSLQRTAIRAF